MMHEGEIVHEDIWNTNILINHQLLAGSDEDVQVHFIDFDWAGHDGMARYLIDVNIVTMKWPNMVKGGGTYDHAA